MRPPDDVNTRYMLHYVTHRVAEHEGLRVLDFGCGRGEVARALRERGVDVYGVDHQDADAFFGDSSIRQQVGEGALDEDRLRTIEVDGRLPFEDSAFDLVISNMVLEHVEDLETATSELHRVLRPGGIAYHHFPSREVLREKHIGIPLTHRLPRGRLRHGYATVLRRLGLGMYRDSRPASVWASDQLAWIDAYTTYRPYREIRRIVDPFFDVEHREIEYCRFRAGQHGPTRALIDLEPLVELNQRLFRRLAFMALELRRRPLP